MIEFPNFSFDDLTAIKDVLDKNVKHELDFEECEELFAAIVGAASVMNDGIKRQSISELQNTLARAKALQASLVGVRDGIILGFALEEHAGDFGSDFEDANDRSDEWIRGLGSVINGLEHEIEFKRQRARKGRPTMVNRNIFWAFLETLWLRDVGGGGAGKVGDEWTGGVIDFIAACSRPVMLEDEITHGKIGEFLKSQKKNPVLKFHWE